MDNQSKDRENRIDEMRRQVASMPIPTETLSTCPECGQYTLRSGSKYDDCDNCGYNQSYY